MLVILLSNPWSPKKPQRVLSFSGIFLKQAQRNKRKHLKDISCFSILLLKNIKMHETVEHDKMRIIKEKVW